jgi:hypothetical protein
VFTIQAGFHRHYLAVGDKIRVNNEPAFAVKIVANLTYSGRGVPDASRAIDRQGHHILEDGSKLDPDFHPDGVRDSDFDLDLMGDATLDSLSEAQGLTSEALVLELARLAKEREEGKDDGAVRKNAASHRVYFRYAHQVVSDELNEDQYIDNASEFNLENAGLLNYASTVHKAQGSEGHHVLLALHRSHASHLSRETLYTAITRARVKLTILTCSGLIAKGAAASQFPGNDWRSKAHNYVAKHGPYVPKEDD